MPSSEVDKIVPVKFGDFIRAARKKRGLTMEAAAKLLHCTRAWVHTLETKPNQNPTIDTLANMAAVYGVDLCEMTRVATACSPDAEYRATIAPVGRRGKR
jgi:transcriptional regulator with XRE-family HTH domain